MTKDFLRSQFKGLPIMLFVVVAFLFALGFLLVSVPEPKPGPQVNSSAGSVSVVHLGAKNGDRVLQLEAQLRDPNPLFLPTIWNVAHAVQADRLLERPGDSFEAFPAKLVFAGGENPLVLPAAVRLPESPAKALDTLHSDKPFIGLAPRAAPLPALPQRAACVELREAATGREVARLQLTKLSIPGTALWLPAEFVVCMHAGGLVGSPALVSGTGVEAVDRVLEKALVQHWPELERLGRLEPGMYRILFGP